jgi:hypothetical protein
MPTCKLGCDADFFKPGLLLLLLLLLQPAVPTLLWAGALGVLKPCTVLASTRSESQAGAVAAAAAAVGSRP